jgi:cytochrome c oxidase cbb3-type subunit I/II
VGGKYPDLWHYKHMMDPRSTSQNSIMPPYAFLSERRFDKESLPAVMRVMRTLGVPYGEDEIGAAPKAAAAQAEGIAKGLNEAGEHVQADSEIVALIAYLQRLGTDNKK